jgi:hypothetical protein
MSDSVSTIRCSRALHHRLGALAVERADEGQGEHSLPEGDHRGGELHHLFLLPEDDPLPVLLEHLGGVEAERVEEHGHPPAVPRELVRAPGLGTQPGEDRLLEAEDEGGGLAGAEALDDPAGGDLLQEATDIGPPRAADVRLLSGTKRLEQEAEELTALLPDLVLADELRAERLELLA